MSFVISEGRPSTKRIGLGSVPCSAAAGPGAAFVTGAGKSSSSESSSIASVKTLTREASSVSNHSQERNFKLTIIRRNLRFLRFVYFSIVVTILLFFLLSAIIRSTSFLGLAVFYLFLLSSRDGQFRSFSIDES